jgi:class 3 adenylate cyclase/CHASE2 domain-containing sensor protein
MSVLSRRIVGLSLAELLGIGTLLVLIMLLGTFGTGVPGLGLVDEKLDDLRTYILTDEVPTHPKIAVVTIDEKTLERTLRRSPIDRDVLARLLRRLAEAKPAGIALDVLIDQASDPVHDDALRQELQTIQVPVTLAWADGEHDPGLMQPWQTQYLAAFTASIDNPRVLPGSVRLPVDDDDTRRRLPDPDGEETILGHILPFAENLLAQTGVAYPLVRGPIAWWGRQGTGRVNFKPISADLVLSASGPAWAFMSAQLAGRYVLVGSDLPDTDRHTTPFTLFTHEDLPGIYIHANILAQLLGGTWLREAPVAERFALALSVVAAGFLFGYRISRGLITLALIFLLVAVIWITAFAAYALPPKFGGPATVIPLADPSLAAILACIVGVVATRRRFQEERNFVRTALRSYISPAVANRIIADPTMLKIGGERLDITALFTDIEDFTSLSESLEPTVLASVLNGYLAGMTKIVLAHDGTLDKYIGDALVAHWGAPLPDPEHAAKALRCALALAEFARDYSARQTLAGIPLGRTRIGLHSGPAIVGNFGGEQRNYTAIGDTVNTAARLEGANKLFHTSILVGEPTIVASGYAMVRPIGAVTVKGRHHAITIYEPVPDWSPERLARYLAAYRDVTAEAEGALETLRALDADDDPIVRLHIARLEAGERGAGITLTEK